MTVQTGLTAALAIKPSTKWKDMQGTPMSPHADRLMRVEALQSDAMRIDAHQAPRPLFATGIPSYVREYEKLLRIQAWTEQQR